MNGPERDWFPLERGKGGTWTVADQDLPTDCLVAVKTKETELVGQFWPESSGRAALNIHLETTPGTPPFQVNVPLPWTGAQICLLEDRAAPRARMDGAVVGLEPAEVPGSGAQVVELADAREAVGRHSWKKPAS